MSRPFSLCAVVLVLATGCDADGDGLSKRAEAALGTDPTVADTDGDGLSDGEERDLGTNPISADSDDDRLSDLEEALYSTSPIEADTDGDGYADGDEVAEGTDPLSADSVIYAGGWPYQWNKDSITGDTPSGDRWEEGAIVGRLQARDQFGEQVDLFDYALHGKLTILDSSALWCGPCRSTANWMATGRGSLESSYGVVREAVNAGDLQWVTVIAQDNYGDTPSVDDLRAWDEEYPNPNIAVMKDTGGHLVYFGVNIESPYEIFPQAVLIDENMAVVARGGMSDVLAAAKNRLD